MSSEDKELLARISDLAGHINRHKNQQAGITAVPSGHHGAGGYRTHTASRAYHPYAPRGRGGYYRGASKPAPYRNRTLVLNSSGGSSNGAKAPDQESGDSTARDTSGAAPSAAASRTTASGTSWVARTDRHMQLINSSVYEKDAQARTKAMELTRLQKQKLKDTRERAKLMNHMSYLTNRNKASTAVVGRPANGASAAAPYQIVVQGIPFSLAKNGSKLAKLPGDPNPPSSTPKVAIVGGVKFYRSKNGNLYRNAVIRAQRRSGTVKKIAQPCKQFSTTGSCSKGPLCRYIHDPAKVAVCKEFLQKGDCANGSDCDLSHDLTPERTPLCLHFAKGNCTNPHCPYAHSQVPASAPVCRPFGLYGYCAQGADCTARHVFECPDFSNTGVCKTKGCKLPHRERASLMRRSNNASATDSTLGGAQSDVDFGLVDASSDESVSSDDVDSDEVDEFVGADADADADLDFVTQKDYIEF